MRRREFISAIGGGLVSWSAAAYAQQVAARPHRIGILAQDLQPGLLETFRDELHKLGYVEGTNATIALRNAAGENERLPALADELLGLKVEVIVGVNTPAVQAAKKATQTVPIVMMRVADPVKSGLVASLPRPGGNVTGLSFMPDALGPKGVELLHEILPQVTRMASFLSGKQSGRGPDRGCSRTQGRTAWAEVCSCSGERSERLCKCFGERFPCKFAGALRHGRWSDNQASSANYRSRGKARAAGGVDLQRLRKVRRPYCLRTESG